ncbi:hypothetical protein OROHE_008264 [Orobanche hederae]
MLFHPNLLASISLTHEDRWLLFPPGTPFHDRPPPSPSPPPPHVPHRPSRLHSQSSSELNIVPHPLIPGVYVSNHGNCNGNTTLYTKNLVPGVQSLHNYDDVVVSVQDEDGTSVEYREWSPFESKLAASILSGAKNIWIVADIDNIDPRCLVSSMFWTSQDSYRRLTLYEKQKNLLVFMLFESSCGYALFRARDMYKVERNFIAIEEYINRFDEFFEFIACHTFESTNEALMHLEAACNGSLTTKLKEFLVFHLPTPTMKGDEHCYSLALPDPFMADDLLTDYKIACSSSPFPEEIIRGVRKNIDKFFRTMKPGDLEKAQLDLARAYCRQKLISP